MNSTGFKNMALHLSESKSDGLVTPLYQHECNLLDNNDIKLSACMFIYINFAHLIGVYYTIVYHSKSGFNITNNDQITRCTLFGKSLSIFYIILEISCVYIILYFRFKDKDDQYVCNFHVNQKYQLTWDSFKQTLKDQPKILHMALHGSFKDETHEHILHMDKTPIIRVLLHKDNPFSGYYAAISILIETEISQFIGQKRKKTISIPISNQYRVFKNRSLMELLECIVIYRFGCWMEVKNNKIIISLGKYKKIKTKNGEYKLEYIEPNTIHWDYLIRRIYKNEKKVKGILKNIMDEYNRHLLAQRECVLYDWYILLECLQNNNIINQQILNDYLNNMVNDNNEESKQNYIRKCTQAVELSWSSFMDTTLVLKSEFNILKDLEGMF